MPIRMPGAITIVLLSLAPTALAGPVTLDDLLAEEAVGRVAFSTSGDHLVIDHHGPHGARPRFDAAGLNALRGSRVLIADPNDRTDPTPLAGADVDEGLSSGPFSPSGRRMVVYGFSGHRRRLGIADLQLRSVTWTEVAPLPQAWGRSVVWRSEDTLLVLGSQDGEAPSDIRYGWFAQTTLPGLWEAAALGRVSSSRTLTSAALAADLTEPQTAPPSALWSVDARTGLGHRIAAGDFIDMELSPDRRSVALIELTTPLPFPARPLTSGTASRKRRLGMVELDTGELVHPVGAGDVMSHLLVWSPNGSDVLVISRPEDEAPADPRFLRVSAAGRVETLDGDGLRPWSVAARSGAEVFRAGWLGDDPVVLAARADEKPRWWHIGRADPESVSAALDAPGRWLAQTDHASAFEADGRVWRVDVSGRSAPLGDIGRRPLTLNSDAFGARLANDPMGAIEVLTRDEVGRVCRFALRHEGEPLCSASDPNDTVVAADPASGRIVTRRSDARGTTTLTLQDPGGDRRGLLTLNAGLATIDHAPPIALGPDAESGWLYLPSRPPGSPDRVPVVVVPYPGTRYGSPPRAMAPGGGNVHFNPQLLVAEGYAVLYPNLPRSPDAEPSAGIADAILAAVDLAARLHPIDSDRIGVWGWSFGGYGAVVAAAQSPRFKAIASMNGIMNLISVPGAIDPSVRLEADAGAYVVSGAGWLEGGQAGLQASLWQDPELYARNSPVLSADRISAPVLLITSDQDAGLAQNEEMFAALNRLNKPARLITYFGEGHALLSPANLREMYAAVIDWFDRFLRRGETPGSPSSAEASLP